MRAIAVALAGLLALSPALAAGQGRTGAQGPAALPRPPSPADEVSLPGLPAIGLWMLQPDGGIASWLGRPFRGKGLLEPVNVVLIDTVSATADEAIARLVDAAAKEEFELREGHSSGYSARIGGELFGQAPEGGEKGRAFSDGPFEFANNHGRVFGPLAWEGGWVFTAAFSRETTDVVSKVKHHYASFDQARDAFAWALDKGGAYRVLRFASLGNAVLGSDSVCTGDHDGMAAVLVTVAGRSLGARSSGTAGTRVARQGLGPSIR